MSSRPHPALFESTHSALLLSSPGKPARPDRDTAPDAICKSDLDKSFWILRELGRCLVLVDHGAAAELDFTGCPQGIPI
jgi:hypothetical protein